MPQNKTIVVIGGGAAGFFGAITCADVNPQARVILLEKTQAPLAKVRISGGGRCNVTHACFEPKQLIHNYPRGHKELLGPFMRFQPRDTVAWFKERGVELKVEEDGRMFPITDSSQTIIDCLQEEARRCGVDVRLVQKVERIEKSGDRFTVQFSSEQTLECDKLLLASGSSPQGYAFAQAFGHSLVSPVPSLFTFNVPASPLLDLAGISLENATLAIVDTDFEQTGPLLITHWGFSGPAALKLSAWAARALHQADYRVDLKIDWLPELNLEQKHALFIALKKNHPAQTLLSAGPPKLPKNLWKRLVEVSGIDAHRRWADLPQKQLQDLARKLQSDIYQVEGKTTYKQEFVTSGGINLKEVDFKTMESRICPGLYFAGEILDIDGVTGGFNFQNAWTTAWLAGHAMAS